MNLSTFKKVFAVAVYHATEIDQKAEFSVGDILDKYSLQIKPTWPATLLKDMEYDGLLEFRRHLGPMRGQYVSMSSRGIEWVEDELDENVAAFLEQHGASRLDGAKPALKPNDAVSAHSATEPDIVYHPPLDSQDWTGIAAKIDAAKLVVVKDQVNALLLTIDQSDCDDRTKKNARKHAEAVVALLEAPDPPWKVIVELLNNPIFTAFLNTAAVLSLIFGS